MKKEFKDLTGDVFGRLTVVSRGPNTKEKCAQFYCLCSCGAEKLIRSRSLLSGKTISCGCNKSEKTKIFNSLNKRTHGHKANGKVTTEYQTWTAMIDRTTNPNNKSFHRYGGRGIKICDRWLNSFENFLADMGYKPTKGLSIDRIDTNGNYEPSNCRWATALEQQNNRSSNVVVSYNGENNTISDWARKFGFKPYVIFLRLRNGWSFNKAITTPKRIQ